MTNDLCKICQDFGVTVVQPAQHRPFTSMQTAAGNTLAKILRVKGETHLRDVLTVLTESENNRNMLIAPVIKAVSRIMAENPTWYANDASKFLEVLDGADLAEMYSRAKANKGVVAAHDTIATLLLDQLRVHFKPETQPTLI